MSRWPKVKVKVRDIATFLKGKKPAVTYDSPIQGAKPYILIENFNGEYRLYTDDNRCVACYPEDTLIVADGANCGLVSSGHNGFLGSTIGALRPDSNKIHPRFLFFFIHSLFDVLNTRVRGAAVPHLEKDLMLDLEVVLPPLPEQEGIIRILDEADQLRRLREESDRRSKDLIPSTFHEMFGDTSVAVKNCKVVRLEEVTTRITDGVHLKPNYTSSGIPFISVKDITTGKLKFDHCKFISREDHERFTKRCKPEYLDILYTKVGATYGRPALVDTSREFSIYVSVCLIKPNKNLIEPQFLNTVMGTAAIKGQADQAIKGIGVPDLHLDQIKNFLIPLPSIELQRKFTDRVAEIKAYEAAQAASWAQLDRLFLSLLHRAFQGEL